MDYKKEINKKADRGFSVFTVIVAISFIGILAMLVIYVSVANFQMKLTDLKQKDDFYTAEQALEEIRVGLQENVGDAMSSAYTYVLENYSQVDETGEAAMDQLRQQIFREKYVEELRKLLKNGKMPGEYDLELLSSYVDQLDVLGAEELLQVVNVSGKAPELRGDAKTGVLLKNLKVIYVDSTGIASIIESDIRLGIPEVQFPTPSTLPDLMNMIVVADKGIICEGNENALNGQISEINGSVYAGLLETDGERDNVSIQIQPNGQVKASRGERLVCQGEIQVGEQGSFSSDDSVALWAQGITLASAQVEILGKTYLADDLTVEKGMGSQVTVAGEYYGYGSREAALAEDSRNKDYFKGWPEKSLSSAITINGKNTTMDLSGISKIMLAGKNYIGTGNSTFNSHGDVMTGESLTVKGSQLAYLVPAELLFDGNQTNPMTHDEYLEAVGGSEEGEPVSPVTPEKQNQSMEIWGGRALKDLGVDEDMPVKTVFYNDNSSGGAVYFYLNFTDSLAVSAYMQNYVESSGAKEKLEENMAFYFQDGGVTVNDSEAYLRCITNGNVLSFDGESKSAKLQDATMPEQAEVLQEQIGYQNMWYTLNRKMISSYELLDQSVEDPNGTDTDDRGKKFHNEGDPERSVYDNLVNEAEMLAFIEKNKNMTEYKGYEFSTSEGEGALTAAMLHNSGESKTYQVRTAQGNYEEKTFESDKAPFVIDQEAAKALRLVVCTGDVRIKAGVEFNGIIMTDGSITLEAGAKLTSAPLEAAKVFQAQINNAGETVSPKDFFWQGDKYVLGNTSSGEGDEAEGYYSDIFHVADYVEYENWKKK